MAVQQLISGSGYGGMMGFFVYKAVTGDLLSAIILFVILGQSITLLASYAKRLMYAIILGVVAPIVVALDTVNKSIKGNSTILSNWFKEFTITIFMQSFHAILMLVTLNVLSAMSAKITEGGLTDALFGIAAIILTTGLIKFEKIYKQIFGMQDGMVGGLKGQAGKVLAGIKGVKEGAGAILDNGKKISEGRKNLAKAKTNKNDVLRSYSKSEFQRSKTNASLALELENDPKARNELIGRARNHLSEAENAGFGTGEGEREILDSYKKLLDKIENSTYVGSPQAAAAGTTNGAHYENVNNASQAANYLENVKMGNTTLSGSTLNNGNSFVTNSSAINNNSTTTNNANSSSNAANNSNNSNNVNNVNNANNATNGLIVSTKELERELNKLSRAMSDISNKNDASKTSRRKIDDADKEIQKARKEVASATMATFMGPANLAAGIGLGLGAGDDISESLLKGGYATKGLDWAAEQFGAKVGNSIGEKLQRFDKNSTVDNTN